jgi:hypothetical protein
VKGIQTWQFRSNPSNLCSEGSSRATLTASAAGLGFQCVWGSKLTSKCNPADFMCDVFGSTVQPCPRCDEYVTKKENER